MGLIGPKFKAQNLDENKKHPLTVDVVVVVVVAATAGLGMMQNMAKKEG